MKLFSVRGTCSLIYTFASLFSNVAMGADCVQDFCRGDIVITGSNVVAPIIEVDKTKNELIYQNGSYTSRAIPSYLSKRVSSGRFPEGGTVMDGGNSVGNTIYAFEDGRVQYKVGTYLYVTKILSPKIQELNGLKEGTLMIDQGNSVGNVLNVFDNGKIQYQVGNYKYVTTDAWPETDESREIKKGMTVIDQGNSIGTVVAIFKNSKIQYQVGNYKYFATNLEPKIQSLDGIEAGTLVMDSSSSIGKAQHVFRDGRIQYQVGTYSYVSNKLVPETKAIDGFFSGVTMLDSSNSVGTVSNVFRDGRMSYKVGNYNYVTQVSKSEYEVEDHATYKKETLYAAAGNNVGKATRFFNKGKIQFEDVQGFSFVLSKLYPEVQEIGGITAGETIEDTLRHVGTVEKLFENDTVLYSVTAKNKKVPTSARLMFDTSKLNELTIRTWLTELNHGFEEFPLISRSSFATPARLLPETKILLEKELVKSQGSSLHFKHKDKIFAYLRNDNDAGQTDEPQGSGNADAMSVLILNSDYVSDVVNFLNSKRISLSLVSNLENVSGKTLQVNVAQAKVFLGTRCSIAVAYAEGNGSSMRMSKTKTAFFKKGPTACRNLVTSALQAYLP